MNSSSAPIPADRVVWKLTSSSLAIRPKFEPESPASVLKLPVEIVTPPKSESDSDSESPSTTPSIPSSVSSYRSRFIENVDLRQYYYGEMSTTPEKRSFRGRLKRTKNSRVKADSEMDIKVKCTACPKLFKKNSEIIPHIFEHIEVDTGGKHVIREKRQPLRTSHLRCHICLKKTTLSSLASHLKNTHDMKFSELPCRICELYFDTKDGLINHMHRTHPCLDMPYGCDICGYQTSFRTQIFKHFEDTHPKNYVICNFCLMIVPVESLDDMKFLEQHLMCHVMYPERKCPHCTLRFVKLSDLKGHLETRHSRHPDDTDLLTIQFYKAPKGETRILMYTPLDKNPRCARPQNGTYSPTSAAEQDSDIEEIPIEPSEMLTTQSTVKPTKRGLPIEYSGVRKRFRPDEGRDKETEARFFQALDLNYKYDINSIADGKC